MDEIRVAQNANFNHSGVIRSGTGNLEGLISLQFHAESVGQIARTSAAKLVLFEPAFILRYRHV